MDVNDPGLFDMPDREPPATPERPQRGRNRETWARTVTVEVGIIDAEALRKAALRVKESALTIGLPADPDVQDPVADPDPEAAADAFDELA